MIEKLSNLTKKQKRLTLITGGVLILLLLIFIINYFVEINRENATSIVKGVDVSAYQGDIDWKTIESQDIYFAYIKATEGQDYTDEKFETNWKNIDSTGIRKGAYMFFMFDEDGKSQADYFIKQVDNDKNNLPPVIDFELYGDYLNNPLDKSQVLDNLNKTVQALKNNYDKEPVIYTNYLTYNTYLKSDFKELDIWICDLDDAKPEMSGSHSWKFWQYSQRGILSGYSGSERFIDMNIYNGSLRDFNKEY